MKNGNLTIKRNYRPRFWLSACLRNWMHCENGNGEGVQSWMKNELVTVTVSQFSSDAIKTGGSILVIEVAGVSALGREGEITDINLVTILSNA